MLLASILAAALSASSARPGGVAEVYLTEAQALKIAFPAADTTEKRVALLDPEARAAIAKAAGAPDVPSLFRYFVGRKGVDVVGYAVIEDCLGKSEPITYMVATDASLTVRAVEILAYRESRGGEVRQEGWRAQFAGKTPASTVRVGTDIRNVAGATISCRSVTDGVRMQLACLARATRRESPPASACGAGGPWRRMRMSMGTMLTITAHGKSEGEVTAAIDAALAEVDRLDRMLSTYIGESEVSKLNRAAGGDFLPASPELLDLLSRSREFCASTDHAFDVTVGPLVELWKRAARDGKAPAEREIAAARALCGPGEIETDPEHGRARLLHAGAALDFGAIGKGYALDRAASILQDRGVTRALLDFGGQFLALDPPPDAAAWRVDLRDPAKPDSTRTSVNLVHASISTTADYERGLSLSGRRISHVVDPRTGIPVEGILGVSVVCASATEADALSTALFVLGAKAGAELASRRGVAALFVAADGTATGNDAFRRIEAR
jgi:thiamine biosynthesis lipoprotein